VTEAVIESLDHEGLGVAHVDGKVAFIEGGVTGERVRFAKRKSRGKFDVGFVTEVLAPERLARAAALRLLRPLRRLRDAARGGICPGRREAAGAGRQPRAAGEGASGSTPSAHRRAGLGYRNRARLSVHYVAKKGGVLVGFHERKSSFVADTLSCEVLPPHVARLIPRLREMFSAMQLRDRIPQLELAVGDDVTVLVVRNLEALPEGDAARLRAFADEHGVQFWLQPAGPDTARPFHPLDAPPWTTRCPNSTCAYASGRRSSRR
jgi:23S rRNA (uracil1939-C5)-methyltransferase